MLFRRVFGDRLVVINVAVASVEGYEPVVGIRDEVERKWAKLKARYGVRERKRRLLTDRSSSVGELNKLHRLCARRDSDVAATVAKFKHLDGRAQSCETDDVFSPFWKPPKLDKNSPDYGRPRAGTLTERRGIAASQHVGKEIIQLCETICEYGVQLDDGCVVIDFGTLFDVYVFISDKVVGMLLRARRYGLVHFEGEMLYQRRDERVPITMVQSLDEIRFMFSQSDDPARCLTHQPP